MDSYPKLNVIVPVFNTRDYVLHCLSSILNQSYKNLELFIIDDGSTDGSAEIIQNYIKNYKNACLEKSDRNYGAGHARNVGLSLAKSDFIGFVDSDDWLDSDFYSVLIDTALKDRSDIAVCGITDEFVNANRAKPRYVYRYENCVDSHFALELLSRNLNRDIYITPIVNNKVYKRSVIGDLRFDNSSYYEDDIFTFWALSNAKKISISSKTTYHYYQRDNSIMHSFSNKHIDDLFCAFSKLKNDLSQRGHEYEAKYIFPAYFKKCITSMLSHMFKVEQSTIRQKEYFKYFMKNLLEIFTPDDLINHLDLSEIQTFFGL